MVLLCIGKVRMIGNLFYTIIDQCVFNLIYEIILGCRKGYILFRLATDGFPISCEGDVDGVLGCTIAKFLGCGAVYLSDWLEHDQMTLTLWHGGMAPLQLSEPFDSSYHKRYVLILMQIVKIGLGEGININIR